MSFFAILCGCLLLAVAGASSSSSSVSATLTLFSTQPLQFGQYTVSNGTWVGLADLSQYQPPYGGVVTVPGTKISFINVAQDRTPIIAAINGSTFYSRPVTLTGIGS